MKFENIYIEDEIKSLKKTKSILSRIKYKNIIFCDKYTEIFNPKNQNFRIQKINPNIILAKKYGKFILKTPPKFNIGFKYNYYFSHMLNCVYDCKYCFLQGMFNSANFLVFVNYEDFFKEIECILTKNPNKKICFFSGYDCDSLALEKITNFLNSFLTFFEQRKNAFLEVRTKSTNIEVFKKIKPINNVIIAYSLNPEEIIQKYEQKTPTFAKRLESLHLLQSLGWRVGIRFDPIFVSHNNVNIYNRFVENIFLKINPNTLHSVTIGEFRMPNNFLNKILKIRTNDSLEFLELHNNKLKKKESYSLFKKKLRTFVSARKIYEN